MDSVRGVSAGAVPSRPELPFTLEQRQWCSSEPTMRCERRAGAGPGRSKTHDRARRGL